MSVDEPSSHSALASVGAQLSAHRQAQNMSVNEVVNRLKLSPRQVHAIEQDDFASLGPVFSRGFVRNYARLLQLDAQPLLDALQAPRPGSSVPLAVPDERIALTGSLSRHRLILSLLGLIIVIALALAVYQWVRIERPTVSTAAHVSAPHARALNSQLALAPAAPSKTPSQSTPPAEPAAVPSVTVPPAQGSGQIQLKFAQDAWVQITDAGNRLLTSRLYRTGETAQLSGQPPFSAVVGNAANVAMIYNGKPVKLTPPTGKSVAHLTIE